MEKEETKSVSALCQAVRGVSPGVTDSPALLGVQEGSWHRLLWVPISQDQSPGCYVLLNSTGKL